jgi:hypothetical protein
LLAWVEVRKVDEVAAAASLRRYLNMLSPLAQVGEGTAYHAADWCHLNMLSVLAHVDKGTAPRPE